MTFYKMYDQTSVRSTADTLSNGLACKHRLMYFHLSSGSITLPTERSSSQAKTNGLPTMEITSFMQAIQNFTLQIIE